MVITEVKHYENEKGMKIEERIVLSRSKEDEGIAVTRFKGRALMPRHVPGQGKQYLPIEVPIEANTLEEAFGKFEGEAEKTAVEARAAMMEQAKKIQLASNMPTNNRFRIKPQ